MTTLEKRLSSHERNALLPTEAELDARWSAWLARDVAADAVMHRRLRIVFFLGLGGLLAALTVL